jgi:hypothetical protein
MKPSPRSQSAKELDPGASMEQQTLTFKQVQFGECNNQLTFHERDKTPDPPGKD